MNTPLCWICGAPADSAEHMVKSSDFRAQFGRVTQHKPVFRHSAQERNQRIRGANAEIMKFKPSLCSTCNNTRTQPHDRAWEQLSYTLRKQAPPLVRGSALPLAQAFGANAARAMTEVHLYFVKLFGCYAVEGGVPLPIKSFAVAILAGHPHPNVYLDFVAVPSNVREDIWVGDINAVNLGRQTVGAVWYYILGKYGVHVTYHEPGHPRVHGRLGWHPSDVGLQVRLQ